LREFETIPTNHYYVRISLPRIPKVDIYQGLKHPSIAWERRSRNFLIVDKIVN
jgi:hypothetical protein